MAATNTNDVKEKTLNLLCGDDNPWTWGGTDAGCYFAFDRDSTGTVSPPKPHSRHTNHPQSTQSAN